MKQKLQKLLIKYAQEGKYADINFVSIVIDALKCEYGDNDLKKISVINDDIQNGEADFQKLEISINIEMIKKDLLGKFCYKDKQSNVYLVNIYVMLVLMHEFNHFRQRTNYKNIVNSVAFLDKLFAKSFVFLCSNNVDIVNRANNTKFSDMLEVDKFYDEHHDCFAVERLAQIEAYKNIYEIISPIASKIGMPYYLFLNNYFAYKIREYCLLDDMIVSPLDFLVVDLCDHSQEDISCDEEESEEIDADNFYYEILATYNFDDRTSYGLPITEKEYFDTLDFMNVMYAMAGNRGVMYERQKCKERKKDIKK